MVFDFSLQVKKGELIGLVGGNGSGKSTTLRAISGMIKPMRGEILFNNEIISGLAPYQMAQKGLAHVPMGRQLFPNLSVRDNLLMGAYLPHLRATRDQRLKEVMRAIRKEADTGLPVLLVEQNIKQVLQFSDRTYVLENGKMVLEGPSSELEGHPTIRKAYLGL